MDPIDIAKSVAGSMASAHDTGAASLPHATVEHVVHIVPPPPGGLTARLRRLRGVSDPTPGKALETAQHPIQQSGTLIHPVRPALADDLALVVKDLTRPDALLTVDDVCARYGGCDPRTARAIMWQAGAFRAAGKVWVHHGKLVAYETASAERGAAPATPASQVPTHHKRRSVKPGTEGVEVDADDWYLEA